ncbi:hypothetical protein FS837_002258 [Tulasnella sp. UAMH 9824]|nr:hypothetical protein FS837_002258 [Tulasnella sp. UAMH 9824]
MADTEAVHRVELIQHTPIAGALRMLATGDMGERSIRELFPALKELCIGEVPDGDEWKNLLRVLRRRQGDIEAKDGDQHLNPLRSLDLTGDWYMRDDEALHHLEEARRLLGHDGKLVWYRWIVTEDRNLEEHWG